MTPNVILIGVLRAQNACEILDFPRVFHVGVKVLIKIQMGFAQTLGTEGLITPITLS